MQNRDLFRLSYLSISFLLCVSTAKAGDPGTLVLVANAGKWIFQTAATVALTMVGAKQINKGRFTGQTYNAFDGTFDIRQEVGKAVETTMHNDAAAYHDRGVETSTPAHAPAKAKNHGDIPLVTTSVRVNGLEVANPASFVPNAPVYGFSPQINAQTEKAHEAAWARIEKDHKELLEYRLEEAQKEYKEKRDQATKDKQILSHVPKEETENYEFYERRFKESNNAASKARSDMERRESELQFFNAQLLQKKLRKDGNPFKSMRTTENPRGFIYGPASGDPSIPECPAEVVEKVPAEKRKKISDDRKPNQAPDPRNDKGFEMCIPDKENEKERARHCHIFKNEDGHILECTPEARALLQTAFKEGIYLGQDMYDNFHISWINPVDGLQAWLKIRPNGLLMDGGASPAGHHWIHHPETNFLVKPKNFKPLGRGMKIGMIAATTIGYEIGAYASEAFIESYRDENIKRLADTVNQAKYTRSIERSRDYKEEVYRKAQRAISEKRKYGKLNIRAMEEIPILRRDYMDTPPIDWSDSSFDAKYERGINLSAANTLGKTNLEVMSSWGNSSSTSSSYQPRESASESTVKLKGWK